MMRGKIIRGVGGFYYIHPESAAADVLIECKAKGIFRNRNIKPLVGDNVEFEMLDEQAGTGNITEICLLYTSPSPRDIDRSRMPSSA